MTVETSSNLHIALCGPASVVMLEALLGVEIPSEGETAPGLPTLAGQFVAAGHHVTVVSTAADIRAPLRFKRDRLGLVLVPARPRARDLALSFFRAERRALAGALREIRPDVIHAQWTYEFALAATEAAVAPVLVTARDSPIKIFALYRDSYRFFRLLLAIRARFSIRHISAPSPYLARSLRWFGYFGNIPVIPNPIPAMSAASPGIVRCSSPIVLCVANASRGKNVQALLRAMATVRARHSEAQLRLVGPGLGAGGPIEAWARQHGLDAGTDFVGQVDRSALPDEYAQASVFCSPSLEESFGNTLIEALHAGLPVIAGKSSGAVPWVLFDGRAGRLVDVRDPSAIAAAVSEAIDDPSSTTVPGFDVAQAIADRYGTAAVAEFCLTEYRRVMEAEQSDRHGRFKFRVRAAIARVR